MKCLGCNGNNMVRGTYPSSKYGPRKIVKVLVCPDCGRVVKQ